MKWRALPDLDLGRGRCWQAWQSGCGQYRVVQGKSATRALYYLEKAKSPKWVHLGDFAREKINAEIAAHRAAR